MRFSLFLVSILFLFSLVAYAPQEARVLPFPAISGDQLVLSYAGDLYTVPSAGGNDPAREFAGIDDQLNKAIEVILEELKTQEVKLPPIPPFPKK